MRQNTVNWSHFDWFSSVFLWKEIGSIPLFRGFFGFSVPALDSFSNECFIIKSMISVGSSLPSGEPAEDVAGDGTSGRFREALPRRWMVVRTTDVTLRMVPRSLKPPSIGHPHREKARSSYGVIETDPGPSLCEGL